MVYVCDSCGALFSRAGKQDHCPDCGERLIRSANQVEREEYTAHLAELIRNNCVDAPRFPNTVMTEISMLNCFAFSLPATALQIDSPMMVEISVEFGVNAADQNELTANIWARQERGKTIRFLMSIHLPTKQGEAPREQARRFFAALSGNQAFTAKLFDFVTEQLEHGA